MDKSTLGVAALGIALCVALAVMSPITINVSFFGNSSDDLNETGLTAEAPRPVASCDEMFVVVESMPELVGGLQALQGRITYPASAKAAGEHGRVFVQFVVAQDGSVKDPVVLRGVSPALNAEALRGVTESTFTPGRQRGQNVCVKMTLPVTFEL